ncbi:MAG: phosphatidate cytidylyltransferase [Rubrivivax sp.]|nr:phosphatidate cytidylyltransferase [Rubrivivax sp.]
MLKLRIITALLMLAVLLPALFAPVAWPFAAVSLLLIAAAAWEWGRLNGAGVPGAWVMGASMAAAGAAAYAAGWTTGAPPALWWLAAAVWVLGGALVLHGGPAAWPHAPRVLRLMLGLVVLFVGWLALSQARAVGINFVLSVMALVWAADIAAYAGGRGFGRTKLAPTVSPGKTWEGALSGAAAVLVLGAVWLWVDRSAAVDSPSVTSRLLSALGMVGAGVALLALSAMSVVGDLVESLVKRAAGAKDSSRLLPGHGGVLDRIDALLPVFPCAMALVSLAR